MICYRDRTYCNSKDCDRIKCDDRLTDEVVLKAKGLGLPVSVSDFSKYCRCYVKKTDI